MHDVSQGELGQVRARKSLKCDVTPCEKVVKVLCQNRLSATVNFHRFEVDWQRK